MNKKLLTLLFCVAVSTLSFVFGNAADAKVAKATFTEIGYQKDADYYYTFYINLGKEDAPPLAYVQVQKNATGTILKLENFKGYVAYWKGSQFAIRNEATVSFYDGEKLVEKKLTGVIEGGVKM
ncbi:hypothetical protein [Chitinophaga ginsengisoli]|uniref:Uncharacterized protein n=1 Tax=Chitinophaga ginsengisoli TaxID=363837 RepID=A0A2P8FX94_9BACT|nr:hypothetical protein [Chitinophaga ginsengisoli]PSL26342.1 hypothetical protein CLV42_11153 [Chitinophaga ginsengisoli]